eukprot:11418870-Karenia_brevis.AAC.1
MLPLVVLCHGNMDVTPICGRTLGGVTGSRSALASARVPVETTLSNYAQGMLQHGFTIEHGN